MRKSKFILVLICFLICSCLFCFLILFKIIMRYYRKRFIVKINSQLDIENLDCGFKHKKS